VPDELGRTEVAAALAGIGQVEPAPTAEILRRWLDTFDWRLWSSGARLVHEIVGSVSSLRWVRSATAPEVVLPAAHPPLRAPDLPLTLAGREMAGLIGNRALIPVAARRLLRTELSVLDPEGKTVVRVALEQGVDLDDDGRECGPGHTLLAVEGLLGYDREHDAAVAALAEALGPLPEADDGLDAAAGAAGRSPGGYRSRPRLEIGPEEPAEAAVRRYLGALLDVVVANVAGIRDDLDVEFLHDLRVAVRRSRAALGQLDGVVPRDVRKRWGPELRRLGGLTGPCRDLDVFLEELPGLIGETGLDEPDVLVPFVDLLRRQRTRAHGELVRSLEEPRFAAFVAGWRGVLEEPFSVDSGVPVAEVARARIRRAHRRVLKRGAELGPESAAERFHRLRIDAKKLRYLLELFAGVLETERAEAAVRELKRIQDVLGGLQDVAVQRERLTSSARELLDEGDGEATTLLAMGRLLATLDTRETRLRREFLQRFAIFAADEARGAFAELLQPGEGP
jgi:CHAD domain-containing protein